MNVLGFLRNLINPALLIGLVVFIVVLLVLRRYRNILPLIFQSKNKQFTGAGEVFRTSSEVRYRNEVYRFAQRQHLSSSLFSLDEIAIVPKVLTPLIQASHSIELAPTDSVSLAVPYIPDWPEFGAKFKASTMTLIEALQGGANIILAGNPGSGKTVALAWLASALAQNQRGLGNLQGILPFYIHAQQLWYYLPDKTGHSEAATESDTGSASRSMRTISYKHDELIDILIKSIAQYISSGTAARLPGIIRNALEGQYAMILLDGLDELPPQKAYSISHYLKSLVDNFPRSRLIVAASYENLAGLPAIGFSLIGIAAWGDDDRENFLSRWSRNWTKWLYPSEKDQNKKINPNFLNKWLMVGNSMLTPLEYVLKVWAAYSGDLRGTDGPSAIETYILRMVGNSTEYRTSVEQFALKQLLDTNQRVSIPESTEPLDTSLPDTNRAAEDSTPDQTPTDVRNVGTKLSNKVPVDIDRLIENGLIVNYPDSRYRFSHLVFAGYLAGKALSTFNLVSDVITLPSYTERTLALYYLSSFGDVSSLINDLIQGDDILHTNHLLIARWLQVAPKNRPWRSIVLRTLVSILQKEKDTASLSAKIIAAMALSGDQGVGFYLRQLLKSDHPNLKLLAILGCGVLADTKAIPEINEILQEQSPASIRAASLALAAIGDKPSLEILATSLLNGNEILRRSAAEALANNPVEGHPALKDGSTMEDLMVRRAVAFGLIRVNLPWATKIVENMQLEDSEWVVRNAAIQAFDEIKRKASYAPKPLQDLTETQWLIDYATRIGTTVAPGKPAEDLVIKALTTGTQDDVLNALDYLRNKCTPHTMKYIYSVYANNNGEIKDLAYYVLWLMLIAGIRLPTSVKYNI